MCIIYFIPFQLPSPDEDETCKTFILKDEDHTLGNALRYIISQK